MKTSKGWIAKPVNHVLNGFIPKEVMQKSATYMLNFYRILIFVYKYIFSTELLLNINIF